MNTIYLRRRSKVVPPTGTGTTPLNVVASSMKNVESLGFVFDPALVDALTRLSPAQVDAFHHRLVKDLREMVGAHREYRPMYPNFPRTVMKMREAELYLNALYHYLTLDWPPSEVEPREPLAERTRLRLIGLGTREDFENIFTLSARSKSPFSPTDREDARWFVAQYRDGIRRLLPDEIPCKENLAVIAAEMIRETTNGADALDGYVKTATDVLRIAAAMSGGDPSLTAPCKFGKFRRAERVRLLGWIERAENRIEDMRRWKGRWIRLGERLHPLEYLNRFPEAADAFDAIRNDRPIDTPGRRIETGLERGDTAAVLDVLETRPGEFARRLDHLCRVSTDASVIDRFAARADRVSTPVLLQALTHFRHRDEPADPRVFFPKGSVAKVFAKRVPLPPLSEGTAAAAADVCERVLLARFAKLPPLGRCLLDERMRRYLAPFALRSASKALRTLVRGSRLPLPFSPNGGSLRFFVWWRNGTSRADVDLSAVLYGEDFEYAGTLAYYNLKEFGAHHSGDIVDAPLGAAEFIDIDLARMAERRVRYVMMCLNSFTAQPYRDLPECFAGWMARESPNSGEIFEPRTVVDKVDIASDTRVCIPAVFDLVEREVVWGDIALSSLPRFANNVHNNLSGLSLMLRALIGLRRIDLFTLFDLHIRARGERVSEIESADTVFSVEQGITPFDLDRIGAEFM